MALTEANAAAAAKTTGMLAAGADEVSAPIAASFSGHAQAFQALSADAAAFHQQFARSLAAGASLYASAEAANTSPLQTLENDLLGVINAPTEALFGRPLIGNGAPGTAAHPNGGGDAMGLFGGGGRGGIGGGGGSGGLIGNGGVGGDAGSSVVLDPATGGRGGDARLIGNGGNGGGSQFGVPGGIAGTGGLLFGGPGVNGPA